MYTLNINGTEGAQFPFYITNDVLFADITESYVGNLQTTGSSTLTGTSAMYDETRFYNEFNVPASTTGLKAFYIDTSETQPGIFSAVSGFQWHDTSGNMPQCPSITTSSGLIANFEGSVETNIPIFDTQANAIAYLAETSQAARAQMIHNNAVNYGYPAEAEGDEFEIVNVWTHGTWNQYGYQQVSGASVNYRNVRGKIVSGGKLAFYDIPGISDGALKIGVKASAVFSGLQYSTDGVTWIDAGNTFPFQFFYKERTDEYGTFDFALTFVNNRFTHWNNESDATDYIAGNKDESEAPNWDKISGNYPIINTTGDDDSNSDFGDVYTRGFFSQQYILDSTALDDIANALFDTSQGGIWEDIKKGLEMFGDNPIEAVMGLSFWPFPLTTIFSGTQAQSYIYFGGYKHDLSQGSCNKIIYPNGYKSIGTVKINRSFKSWRDFEPYTKLYVMLPYIGTYQLDLARYYGHNVEVRYYVDTRTNSVIACLIADGFLTDYFNGQMGVTMPITLTDYSSFANAQIQTLLGGGGQAVDMFGSGAGAVMGSGVTAAGVKAAGGAMLGAGAAIGVAGAAIGAKTVYGLTQNNINNFNKTKGGSTSMINEYLPQSVCFIFEIQEDCAPDNYGAMFGYPSMKSGSLSSFSGFLKCQSVKLSCPKATESERERLKQMLLNGIYI